MSDADSATPRPPPSGINRIGLAVGLVGALLIALAPAGWTVGLGPEARRTLACTWLMGAWWIGSGLPVAVPALLPLALFPLLDITGSKEVAAPYADRMVMLLMCGFMLALSIEKWGLHRRLALTVLARVGRAPAALVGGVMTITALLSMWISNTATTLMMLPITVALLKRVAAAHPERPRENARLSQSTLLGLAWSASIGGMATPIGTPPNIIFQGQFAEHFPHHAEVDFARWVALGVPLSLFLLVLAWGLLSQVLFRLPRDYRLSEQEALRTQLAALGPWSGAELRVALGFGLTCALWVLRPWLPFLEGAHDSTIAASMAILFFLAPAGAAPPGSPEGAPPGPLLTWRDARRIPWGLLLMFGGGIALSAGFKSSGLSVWLAERLASQAGASPLLLALGIALAITFLTEVTSNTATTTLMMPILAATAAATGADPLMLMLPATLAASCAFMLPVATAPNAIVTGTGLVDTRQMARAGLVMNLLATGPIVAAVLWFTA